MKKKHIVQKLKGICKVLSITLGVIGILCILGAVWNHNASKKDLDKFPPEGEMVDIADSKIHVFTTGSRKSEEDPAIVLISGLSVPSPVADFSPVWKRLNKEHQIVVLERPGYGWSESTNRERTLENIVGEDALALKNAGVEPPYLLVAHSIGGIEAHLFSATYSDEVQGVLLLDCMSPDLYLHYGERPVPLMNKMASPIRTIGLLRFLNAVSPKLITSLSWAGRNDFKYVDSHYNQVDRIMILSRYGEKNMLEETKDAIKMLKKPEKYPYLPTSPSHWLYQI